MSQLAGKDYRACQVRVEWHSWDAGCSNSDALRRRYSFVLAINGLKDRNFWVELMVGQGLEWGEWKQILKARSVA